MKETQAELVQNRLDYEDRCWRSGYLAYERKVDIERCPLAKGSGARSAWEDGWRKAKSEYEDAPPEE